MGANSAAHVRLPLLAMAALAVAIAGCSSDDSKDGSSNGGSGGAGVGAGASSEGGANAQAGSTGSGADGSTSSAGGASGANQSGGGAAGSVTNGVCLPPLAQCQADAECCNGAICLNNQCRPTCEVRNDCGSLCCQEDATAGRKICVEASLCAGSGECSTEGNSCADVPCCDSMICVDSEVPSWAGCRPPCSVDGDCDSGCCVPFANTTSGFCAESRFCVCGTLDEPCGEAIQCCDGLACTSTAEAGVFACRPVCQTEADCIGGGCCVPLGSTGTNVCLQGAGCP